MKNRFVQLVLLTSVIFIFWVGGCSNSCDEGQCHALTVYTLQPWYDELTEFHDDVIPLPGGIENDSELPVVAGEFLADVIPGCVYPDKMAVKNEVLTKEHFKAMGRNQIVMFQGHGSYEEGIGSVLWNKNWWDWNKEESDPDFRREVEAGRIVNSEFNEAYTEKFIRKYCGNLKGSIIYMGQCLSCKDEILAQAFLDKGAVAVIGNTDAIQTRYGDIMQYTVITSLAHINPVTKDYYTIGEALKEAQRIYGEDELERYPFANGAKPVIYGNASYRIATVRK